VHGKVTAAMGAELIDACAWLMSQRDISCPIPLLMLHGGEDLITSQPASKKLASELRGDVTYHTIPGMYHEIHNEYGQEEVFDKMWNWLEMRLV
jgi:alpha-beta hydrolase superfamily lysophospholipase